MTCNEAQLDLGSYARETRWREFHESNPHVYEMFSRFAMELVAAGRKRIGARLVWERMRWETMIVTTDAEPKLNDHWPPFYARLFMKDHPELGQVFETRGGDELPALSKRART